MIAFVLLARKRSSSCYSYHTFAAKRNSYDKSTAGEMLLLVNLVYYVEGKSTNGIQLLRELSSLSLGFLVM